jgi:hypothetical protein
MDAVAALGKVLMWTDPIKAVRPSTKPAKHVISPRHKERLRIGGLAPADEAKVVSWLSLVQNNVNATAIEAPSRPFIKGKGTPELGSIFVSHTSTHSIASLSTTPTPT